MEEDLNNKWNIHKVVDEAVRGALLYDKSSTESDKKISLLQANQQNIMDTLNEYKKDNKEEHKELFDLVGNINDKLDTALINKADKSEVQSLVIAVEDLKAWKIKILAYGSVILFLVTFLKDEILNLIGKI